MIRKTVYVNWERDYISLTATIHRYKHARTVDKLRCSSVCQVRYNK